MHNRSFNPGWTEARVARLKKLWDDGYSAAQIAVELGWITRNAVLGKVDRLKLSARRTIVVRERGEKRAVNAPRLARPPREKRVSFRYEKKPRRPLKPKAREAEAQSHAEQMRERFAEETAADLTPEQMARTVPLLKLGEHTCRWPYGDPQKPDFCFCGAEPVPGKPYCAEHHAIAHVAPSRVIQHRPFKD